MAKSKSAATGETIGDRIVMARTKKGMSAYRLAKMLEITSGAVSAWERGRKNPNLTHLREIAAILDVSVDYLVS